MADTKDLDLSLINTEDTSSEVVSKLNENFNKIDRHNHTEGTNDVRSSGLIVNSDVDMKSFSLLKSQLLQLIDLQTKLADPNFIVPNNSVYTEGKKIVFKDIDGLEVVIGNTDGATGTRYNDREVRNLIAALTDRVTILEEGGTGGSGSPDTGQQIVEKLEDLPVNEKLTKEDGLRDPEVISDGTLTGTGLTASPLKVAVPFSQAEKNKLAGLTGEDLPVGASSPVKYTPSVIFHDPSRSAGNNGVPLAEVIEQVEANNTLYTERQTGSFVSALNFNPLTVETVTYGTISLLKH